MIHDTRTITVAAYFGDKELTKDQFAKIWANHTDELRSLDFSPEWLEYVEQIKTNIKAKAEDEFEKMYVHQNPEKERVPYYTLEIKRNANDTWEIAFGDWEREVVEQEELDSYSDCYSTRLIMTKEAPPK